MTDQELRRRLEELRAELHGVESVDADLEDLLEELRGDIEQVLEQAESHGLADRLRDAVERFENSHPTLASAMGAVADQLARMGI